MKTFYLSLLTCLACLFCPIPANAQPDTLAQDTAILTESPDGTSGQK